MQDTVSSRDMRILFTRIHFTQALNFRVSCGIRIEFWSYFLYLDSLYAKIWLTQTAKDTKFALNEDLLYLKTIELFSCMRKLIWLAILVFIWPKIVFMTMNKVFMFWKKNLLMETVFVLYDVENMSQTFIKELCVPY